MNMSTTYIKPATNSLSRPSSSAPICCRCGDPMQEADRVAENGALYIWYECGNAGCDEQWLSKQPALSA